MGNPNLYYKIKKTEILIRTSRERRSELESAKVLFSEAQINEELSETEKLRIANIALKRISNDGQALKHLYGLYDGTLYEPKEVARMYYRGKTERMPLVIERALGKFRTVVEEILKKQQA